MRGTISPSSAKAANVSLGIYPIICFAISHKRPVRRSSSKHPINHGSLVKNGKLFLNDAISKLDANEVRQKLSRLHEFRLSGHSGCLSSTVAVRGRRRLETTRVVFSVVDFLVVLTMERPRFRFGILKRI